MTATGYVRGNPVYWDGIAWCFLDGVPIEAEERPCVVCHVTVGRDDPDPCIGMLPGVTSACCGHGVESLFIVFDGDLVSD